MVWTQLSRQQKRESKGTKANTEICMQQGFIDNMTVTEETNIQARSILAASNEAVA